ncbi:MAG: Lrp/AsnC family transcriptional regulator [Acidimicrobiia bacterium]
MASPASLDHKTLRLIELLVADPRRSFTGLGQDLGRSEAWVRQRVKRLRADGLIRFGIAGNPLLLGFGAMGYVGVKTNGEPEVMARLAEIDEVAYLVRTSGRFDAILEVFITRPEELVRLCDQRVARVEGVTAWESFGAVEIVKETYPWRAPA